MPGTIRAAVATDTFPFYLSTKFSESHSAQANWNEYNDGSTERQSLVTGGRRSWKLSKRLMASEMVTLLQFWEDHTASAFYFFNPSETTPPYSRNPVGTNGRYIVRFASDWSETMSMVRSDADVELIELATGDEMVAAQFPVVPGATMQSVTLSVVTAFTQAETYGAFANINPQNPNGPTGGYLFTQSAWSQRTDTFALDPADTNPATYQLYFGIIGTLSGDGTNDFLIYDAALTVHYSSGIEITFRPTTATAVDNSGTVTNPASAIDGDSSTYAQIERSHFSSLAQAPLLVLKNWQ